MHATLVFPTLLHRTCTGAHTHTSAEDEEEEEEDDDG